MCLCRQPSDTILRRPSDIFAISARLSFSLLSNFSSILSEFSFLSICCIFSFPHFVCLYQYVGNIISFKKYDNRLGLNVVDFSAFTKYDKRLFKDYGFIGFKFRFSALYRHFSIVLSPNFAQRHNLRVENIVLFHGSLQLHNIADIPSHMPK